MEHKANVSSQEKKTYALLPGDYTITVCYVILSLTSKVDKTCHKQFLKILLICMLLLLLFLG